MTPDVKFRLIVHKQGLKNAPQVLAKHFSQSMKALGETLVNSARTRMRKDSGAARNNLRYKLTENPNLNINLVVYSNLIQAFVDAYGLRRGVFPDFRVNSKLHSWVSRKLKIGKQQLGPRQTQGVPAGPAKRGRPIRTVKKLKSIAGVAPATSRGRARARNTDSRRLAFLVARSIFQNGIRGSQWNKRTLEANKGTIMRSLKTAFYNAALELKRSV